MTIPALFLVSGMIAMYANAQTYYVSPTGNNANPGTSSKSPWRTISMANKVLVPGDTVYVRGGRYLDDPIRPARSGRAGAEISFIAYNQEVATLSSNSIRGLNPAIDLKDRSYINVRGIHIDGVEPRPNARVASFAVIYNGSFNTIEDGVFRYASGWHGILLDQGSKYNKIRRNIIDYVGAFNEMKDGKVRQYGDSIGIKNADRNLVEGNTMTRGAHNLIAVYGSNNIIRQNTLDNDWRKEFGVDAGARSVEMRGQGNLSELNMIMNAGKSLNGKIKPGHRVEGRRNIVRRNIMYGNIREAIDSTSRNDQVVSEHNHIYNNTFYANGGPAWRVHFYYPGGVSINHNVFKNNIVYNNRRRPTEDSSMDVDIQLRLFYQSPNLLGNSIVQGNLIYSEGSNLNAAVFIHEGGNRQSLEQAERSSPNNFASNMVGVPGFVSGNPKLRSEFELSPGSLAIDRAVSLTRTTGSGSGNTIPVVDASYFSDGFSLIDGDRIQIGGGKVLNVVRVDYTANKIQVKETTSWVKGATVDLEHAGSRPDIGALELGMATAARDAPEPPRIF